MSRLNGSIGAQLAAYESGYALPQSFYQDESLYRFEQEKIFSCNWIFAGHESQIPQTGDFFVYELGSESVIVTRNRDGQVKALVNVCRHRGSRVCLEKSGNKTVFTCPYHAWAYDTDGKLIAARQMGSDFDRSGYALHEARLEIIEGLIFITFSDEAPGLDAARRDLTEPLRMFDVANLKLAEKRIYPIAANWKLAVENYHECYHCGPAHPEYARMHTLKLDEARMEKMQRHMVDRMDACGIKNVAFDYQHAWAPEGQQGYAYSRTALFPGYKTGSPEGQPVAPLLGQLEDYDGGASDISVGPFSFFLAYSDHIVSYVFKPVSVDECICEVFWWVNADAQEGTDYKKEELVWLWHVTTKADEEIIINNQAGVNSRYYEPGPYSKMEHWTRRSTDWILDQLRPQEG